jgi:urea transport system substrate-binding protein
MKRDVQRIPVGLLNSRSGPYGYLTSEAHKGALLAIEETNSAGHGFELVPVVFDPKGIPELYQQACLGLIKEHKVQHIIGCYTSASRKQVLPVIERADALLWHPARYEGFEACENIIYVGAAPNQHVVPLAKHLIDTIGRDFFCVGTNYIWTWEMNRVLREILRAAGGAVLGERVVDFGTTDVTHLTEAIVKKKPSVVMSTLVGETSYAFLRAWDLAKRQHGMDIPIVSCSLSEPELKVIGPRASEGHLACSTYFASLEREENRVFVARYQARFGLDDMPFSDAESSYVSIKLLARAIARAGNASVDDVRDALYLDRFEAPRGPVWIDPTNNHCFQTPRIAVSRPGYGFDVFWEANEPLRPDPYLARLSGGQSDRDGHEPSEASNSYSHLRLVK